MGFLHNLTIATIFLTRLPIRSSSPWKEDDLAGSVIMFPLVGVLVGGLGASAYAASITLGLPPFLAASIAIATLIITTGALHEDGLADIADGFGGGRTKETKLRIMHDSRLGSYGTLALVLGLTFRIGALSALADPWIVGMALITTGALSRSAMPAAMSLMKQARSDGLSASVGRPHPGRSIGALIIALAVACLCLPWPQALGIGIAIGLVSGALLLLAQKQIGGITGDVLGALQQSTEIVGLLALVAMTEGGLPD